MAKKFKFCIYRILKMSAILLSSNGMADFSFCLKTERSSYANENINEWRSDNASSQRGRLI